MEKIKIAELDLDVNALIRSTAEVKNAIDVIRKQQSELTKSGDTASNQFVQNAADLRVLTQAYNANLRAIADSTQAQADQANRSELISLALQTEVVSIKEAREQNALLNRLRNEANATTAEGQKEIEMLNQRLDENNAFIQANADAYLRQKINIGNYAESIREAAAEMNPFNGGISGFISRSQEAGGVLPLLSNGIRAVTSGIMGMIKASLAFIATPLGAILAAIAVTVGILYSVFKTFQPLIDKVEQAFAAVSAVVSVLKNTFIALVTGTKSLGEAFSSLGGDMEDAARSAANLKKAQQDLEDAMEAQEIASAKARVEINKLNIQAKDRTKSDEERLALLKKSEELERKDFEQRAKNAKQALDNAKEDLRINADLSAQELKLLETDYQKAKDIIEAKAGNVDDYLETYRDAIMSQTEIDNEATSNLEKNINKQNKLIEDAQAKREKEAEDAKRREEEAQAMRQKALDQLAQYAQLELDLFLANQGIKARTLKEEIALNESVYQQKLNINQKEFEASEKTANDKLELQIKNTEAQNELLGSNTDAILANSQRELQIFIDTNKSKLDANKFLTDELVKQEQERNDLILAKKKEALDLELFLGQTTQTEYNDAINKINEENRLKNEELKLQRDVAEAEKRAIDLENLRIANQENFNNEFAQRQSELDLQKQQEIDNAVKTGADVDIINRKYATLNKAIETDVQNFKRQQQLQTISLLKGLFGEESALGKALAISEVFLNTQQNAAKAFAQAAVFAANPLTAPLAVNANIQGGLIVATGAATIAKIAGAKFEEGGIQEIGGKRHSAGGTKFYGEDGTFFEAEAGEGIGILNRRAFGSFLAFNNQFKGGTSTPTFMQGGGVITQGVRQNQVDTMQLVNATVEVMRNLPPQIVTVEDINVASNNYAQVVNGANF